MTLYTMPVVRDGTTFTSGHTVRYMQPLSGLLLSIVLALASIAVISAFLGRLSSHTGNAALQS